MNQNDLLVESFLNRTFFKAWKSPTDEAFNNYSHLEVQLSGECDLRCKYCYLAKFKKDLYPATIGHKEDVLHNLDILMAWLEENKMYPVFEIFSGEPFAKDVGYEAADKILDFYGRNGLKPMLSTPTNMSFLFDEEKTERMEGLLAKAENLGIGFHLSASVDGKFCEENRPFRDGRKYTDDYYDKLFNFAQKHSVGFHPMVYSNNIERWKENFLWFQEMFKRYGISPLKLYLLEVRNKEWSRQQLKDFYDFWKFVMRWIVDFAPVKKEDLPKWCHQHKPFNVTTLWGTVGRGMGCSVQSTVQLRVGDLTASVCHRCAYKSTNLWKFAVENDKIVGIKAINPELLIAMETIHTRTMPQCESCFVGHFCTGQCLGSMFEVNQDPFMVIPTVCALEHIKVAATFDGLKEKGVLAYFYDWCNPEKKIVVDQYLERFMGGK
jgi:organic radical activating enzyme